MRFPEIDARYIKNKVSAGYYTNETELLQDAVRYMREEDEQRERFRQAVRLGDEDIEQGNTVPYSSELMHHLTKEAITKTEQAESPSPRA